MLVCSEDAPPPQAGSYHVADISLPPPSEPALRPHLMTLH
jgi:hypothetical protein